MRLMFSYVAVLLCCFLVGVTGVYGVLGRPYKVVVDLEVEDGDVSLFRDSDCLKPVKKIRFGKLSALNPTRDVTMFLCNKASERVGVYITITKVEAADEDRSNTEVSSMFMSVANFDECCAGRVINKAEMVFRIRVDASRVVDGRYRFLVSLRTDPVVGVVKVGDVV